MNTARKKKSSSVGAFKQKNAFSLALREHKKHALGRLSKLLDTPFASLMTIVVIAIALTLPACLYLIVKNGTDLTDRWHTSHDISAYIDNSLSLKELRQLSQTVSQNSTVVNVKIITAEDALRSLGSNTELNLLSEALTDNPLPHTLIVTPSDSKNSDQSVAQLVQKLKQYAAIESVELDTAWVIKLENIMIFLQRLIGFLTVILALGVLLIVANTIRLHVINQRNEIEVKKLIGASDRFVRRPFLYTGFWYGFLGATLAWICVMFLQLMSLGPLTRLLDAYGSTHELHSLGFEQSLILFASGSFLALLGAYIAAENTIRRIEP